MEELNNAIGYLNSLKQVIQNEPEIDNELPSGNQGRLEGQQNREIQALSNRVEQPVLEEHEEVHDEEVHEGVSEEVHNNQDEGNVERQNPPLKEIIQKEIVLDSLELELEVEREEPTCPITMMPFINARILLEDGFTYEKAVIEDWLALNPNISPLTREIPSATLLPNYTINKKGTKCPLTQKPFREPYYCLEDGQTYEKEAILNWAKEQKKGLEQGIGLSFTIKSPVNGVELNSLTLYPNKILFKEGIPA